MTDAADTGGRRIRERWELRSRSARPGSVLPCRDRLRRSAAALSAHWHSGCISRLQYQLFCDGIPEFESGLCWTTFCGIEPDQSLIL